MTIFCYLSVKRIYMDKVGKMENQSHEKRQYRGIQNDNEFKFIPLKL